MAISKRHHLVAHGRAWEIAPSHVALYLARALRRRGVKVPEGRNILLSPYACVRGLRQLQEANLGEVELSQHDNYSEGAARLAREGACCSQ